MNPAMTREPIPNCPKGETPIRNRTWTDEQRWKMFRHYLATENDTFMNVFQDGMPSRPTEAQLDATCDDAINSAISAEAQP